MFRVLTLKENLFSSARSVKGLLDHNNAEWITWKASTNYNVRKLGMFIQHKILIRGQLDLKTISD